MVVGTVIATTENIQLENELSNTGYTIEWVLNMLYEHNPKFLAALGSNKVKDISGRDISEGKGFLSRIFRVVVEFSDATNYSFIMKVPTMDCLEEVVDKMDLDKEAYNKFFEEFALTHNKECDAYNLIQNVKNFPKAEVFYSEYKGEKTPGVIVMEYLEKATTIGMFRSVTTQQCLNVARHLGTLQAQMNVDCGWRGKYISNMHTSEANQEEVPKFLNKFIEQRKEFKESIQRLLDVDLVPLAVYSLQKLPAEYNASTLCQGDLWANNCMFSLGKDGSVTDEIAAIIDWQILFEGSPMLDLGRFIAICADGEIRRECERKAVDLLYDTFCENYTKLGKQVSYTREQAHILYDYAFINQSYAMLGMASFVMMSNIEKAPDCVHKAQAEKAILRARLCVEDAIDLMNKHNIFERFPKKI